MISEMCYYQIKVQVIALCLVIIFKIISGGKILCLVAISSCYQMNLIRQI